MEETHAKSYVGISTSSDPTQADSTRRYPIEKTELFKTSDGKKWFVTASANGNRDTISNTTFRVRIYEVQELFEGSFDYPLAASLLVTIAATSLSQFSMSNIAEAGTDVFAVALGAVNATANSVSLAKMAYTAGTSTWIMSGGGSLQDTSFSSFYANFSLKNCDLIFDSNTQHWMLFAVSATAVYACHWNETNASTDGLFTIGTGKTYGTDIPVKVNRQNLVHQLSDNRFLIIDGTAAGAWIYNFNGSAWASLGTNSTTTAFSNGMNGIAVEQDKILVSAVMQKANSTVSVKFLNYDAGTTTLTEETKTFEHNFYNDGRGRDFIDNNQVQYIPELQALMDECGNLIYFDNSWNITSVNFSEGYGSSENMSMRYLDGFMYYFSDRYPPTSFTSNYTEIFWIISKVSLGHFQENMRPIFMGTVTEVTTPEVSVECVKENVTTTDVVKGTRYGDYVAISTTRLIPLNKDKQAMLPSNVSIQSTTDATRQFIYKGNYVSAGTYHSTVFFRKEANEEERFVFQFNKGSPDEIFHNILVDGIPVYQDKQLTVAAAFYYITLETKGTVFAHIASTATSTVYTYN